MKAFSGFFSSFFVGSADCEDFIIFSSVDKEGRRREGVQGEEPGGEGAAGLV